jgi:hypothetical protein
MKHNLIQRSGVRILMLSDFLRSSGSGTVSTRPREEYMSRYLEEILAPTVYKSELMIVCSVV